VYHASGKLVAARSLQIELLPGLEPGSLLHYDGLVNLAIYDLTLGKRGAATKSLAYVRNGAEGL
jgi:hypothetical protein